MDFNKKEIEFWFPNLVGKSFEIFDVEGDFNCVAFTLEIYNDWLWTNSPEWPYQEIPRNSGLNGFIKLYEKHGYIKCTNSDYEEGYEKIAFYSKNNLPQHAAKQFGNIWKSKLGCRVIIEHELEWLCGNTEDAYGTIAFIMKRIKR